jgi:DNA polymerase-3 subunit chi
VSRIDFYVLPGQEPEGRFLLACRLAEKAYELGHKVYIHTASAGQAERLDDLLWTFRQGSFVPHTLYPPVEGDLSPVLIGWDEVPAVEAEVLINLTDAVPTFFERFERVAELVDQNPQTLTQSRERFRFYRERGYAPTSHKL